jgi:AraC-like DNA-binding protein
LPVSDSPTILSVWPKTIVADLREQGRNVEKVLGNAGLDLRTVNREGARIPWLAQAKLLELAAHELEDDCYGLHLAEHVDVRDADLIAYLGLASKTLGEALNNLGRYARVFTEAVQFDLSNDSGAATVNLIPAKPTFLHYRQQTEFSTGLLLNAYRTFTGRDITPLEIAFTHHRRERLREVSRFFGCRISYGERRARIVLKAKDLAIPIPTADYRVLRILRRYGDIILKERGPSGTGLLSKVERLIVDLLPKGMARAKVIAIELGMSDRTLSRRLGEAGTSFDEILDRLRHDLAQRYLVASDLSLSEVAFL